MKAPSERALDLPWLCPSAGSLAALARSASAAVWTELRHDPGCVLLLARVQAAQEPHPPLFEALFAGPAVLDASLNFLAQHGEQGWIDWRSSAGRPVLQHALAQAALAERLASVLDECPLEAWTGAILEPLASFAQLGVCAGRESAAPITDLIGLTRRLCRVWRLPAWLSAVVGHLNLPVALAAKLGARPRLFQIVQLAVLATADRRPGQALACAAQPAELCVQLGLNRDDVDRWAEEAEACAATLGLGPWQKPSEVPLLQDLLHLALNQRRQGDGVWIDRLQQEVDLLQEALDQQRHDEEHRLERLKLTALAELAAGAGHEINNPLAVISGQAQYILKHLGGLESEWQDDATASAWLEPWKIKVSRSLQTIVGQTQRVHHILTDLMQFARPAPPKSQDVRLVALIQEASAALATLAQDKHLRLETPEPTREWLTQGDPAQLKTALLGLVRNAIEAAPPEGSVYVRLEPSADGMLDVVVEDNGPGPGPGAVEHLFDPFFSGRSAGRGRGLGLSTAWRLARQNGGDVRYDGLHDGRTRFVLRLPAQETSHVPYYANGQTHAHESNGRPEYNQAAG